MRLQSRSKVMDAIGFEMGALCETMENSPIVDAAYVATVNEWEGGKSLQLNLKGLRPASPSQ
jgi:single-stranded-DNA-specific exonuclease